MPDGATHYKYWCRGMLIVLPVSGAAMIVGAFIDGGYITEFAFWFLFWYWCGRWVDPDWDLPGITAAEGRIMRELDLLGVFIIPITTFYAVSVGYIIKKFKINGAIGGSHRTWLTHSVIPGTLLRCVLICICIAVVVNWADFILGLTGNGALVFHPYDLATFALAQFFGLGTSDLIHILADKYLGGE